MISSCVFDPGVITTELYVAAGEVRYGQGKYKWKQFARVYTNCPAGMFVDHINGNPLDNRLCNLRVVTRQQNNMNRAGRSKSGLPKGVFKLGKLYGARIKYNYTNYHLGSFLSVEDAEAAYLKAAEKFFKEHAFHISRGDTE